MKYLELFENYKKNNLEQQVPKYIDAMKKLDLDECVNYVFNNCQQFINNPIVIKRLIKKK